MKKSLTISLVVSVVVVAAVGIYVIVQTQKKVASPISNPVAVEPVQQPIKLVDGRQCYTYSHDATKEEPVTSTEFIDMTISGNTVTGTKRGTQLIDKYQAGLFPDTTKEFALLHYARVGCEGAN